MSADKPTFIYGLIDPRNQQLRYVGKTVLNPEARTLTHKWRARAQPHKRHSMAWLLNLERAGFAPDVFVIEEVPAGGDWVEAEQFWIAYFRMIGADLCNHTAGGDGHTGYRHPPELVAKRIRRGPEHHMFGTTMPPHVVEALRLGNERRRADPVRWARDEARRLAAMTPEKLANSIAGLRRAHADPEIHARSIERKRAKAQRPEARALVSRQSSERWATSREEIIAAQNAGKGERWRSAHRELGKKRLSDPAFRKTWLLTLPRKLDDDAIKEIRGLLADGVSQSRIAKRFGVTQGYVSRIKTGRRSR